MRENLTKQKEKLRKLAREASRMENFLMRCLFAKTQSLTSVDKFLCHFASKNKRELWSRQQDEVLQAQSCYRLRHIEIK